MKFEGYLLTILYHKIDSGNAANIGDFVGVTDGGYGTMHHRQSRKFSGHQHATFYVHMAIDEPGQ
jgi:hypothetical protein